MISDEYILFIIHHQYRAKSKESQSPHIIKFTSSLFPPKPSWFLFCAFVFFASLNEFGVTAILHFVHRDIFRFPFCRLLFFRYELLYFTWRHKWVVSLFDIRLFFKFTNLIYGSKVSFLCILIPKGGWFLSYQTRHWHVSGSCIQNLTHMCCVIIRYFTEPLFLILRLLSFDRRGNLIEYWIEECTELMKGGYTSTNSTTSRREKKLLFNDKWWIYTIHY